VVELYPLRMPFALHKYTEAAGCAFRSLRAFALFLVNPFATSAPSLKGLKLAMTHSNDLRFDRKAFLGLLLLGLASVPSLAHAEAAPVEVTAKLTEIPSKMPPDDLYDYAYVMRYQVQGGPLDGQQILVAHYKPLVPRSKINTR